LSDLQLTMQDQIVVDHTGIRFERQGYVSVLARSNRHRFISPSVPSTSLCSSDAASIRFIAISGSSWGIKVSTADAADAPTPLPS
jgi:hypothetical protein